MSRRRFRAALQLPPRPQASGYRIEGGELVVFRNIVENGEMVGTVYLRARYGLSTACSATAPSSAR
jgi:hypothetical protein